MRLPVIIAWTGNRHKTKRSDREMRELTQYLYVFHQINQALAEAGNRQVLAAIDGMCASGKTTLGEIIQSAYDCNVFHMDDYFLRPWQCSQKRLAQPGGNVDYERFKEEVLDHLSDPGGLDYRPYDCRTQSLKAPVHVPWRRLNVVEGAYSQHPFFGDVYDLRFYCGIGQEEQLRRIRQRNGEEQLEVFQSRWIPMENNYLAAFEIEKKSKKVGAC